jgi:hypothetical protein
MREYFKKTDVNSVEVLEPQAVPAGQDIDDDLTDLKL